MKILPFIVFLSVFFAGLCALKECDPIPEPIYTTIIRDSILIVNNNDSIKILSKILACEKAKENDLKKTIAELKKKVDAKITVYRLDTVARSAPCDSAITALEVYADSLDAEAQAYSRQIYLLETMADFQKSTAISQDGIITTKNEQIKALEESNKRNWLERNGAYVGGVVGIIGTILILK